MQGNFLVLTLNISLIMFWHRIFYPYESVYIRSLGASSFIIGIYFAVNSLIKAIVGIPGGYLCDIIGRRRIILIGNSLAAIAWFILYFATDWKSYFAAQILLGIFSFWSIAQFVILRDSMVVGKRGLSFALFLTIMQTAGLASPYIGGWVFENYKINGMRIIILLIGVTYCVKTLIYMKYLKETLEPTIKSPRLTYRILLSSYIETFKTLKHLSSSLLGFIVMEVLYRIAFLAFPFFSLYAFDVISLSPSEWGFIATVEIAVSLFLRVIGGRLADRFSKRRLILILLIIDIPVITSFIYARSFSTVLIIFATWRIIGSLTSGAWDSLKTDLTPKEYRGKVASLTNILDATFGFFGSIAIGYFYDISHSIPLWYYILFTLLAAIIGYKYVFDPEKPEK